MSADPLSRGLRSLLPMLLGVGWMGYANAAIVGDYTGRQIAELYTYEQYGGGDVVFRVNLPVAGCEGGFWLAPTDPGYKSSVALVLSAFHSNASIRVWGHNDQLWSGSGSPTCKLYSVGLAK